MTYNYMTVGKNLSSPTKPDQLGICSIFCLEGTKAVVVEIKPLVVIHNIKGLKSFNVGLNFIKLGLKWSNLGL